MSYHWRILASIVPLLLGAWPGMVAADERHFTYTYESSVLPPGAKELEIWATGRYGRSEFYSRLDQRLEFEFGLTDRLMTSIYLNGQTIAKKDGDQVKIESEFGSVSSEWKYKLLDPVADALGFALYGEVTGATDELELEAKLIFDKRIGDLLLAANLVAEHEWEFGHGPAKRELFLEADLAFSYFFTPKLGVGLELRNHNEITPENGWEHSALFLGPVVSYAEKGWWVSLAVLPQLPALKRSDPSTKLILDEHEKLNARLLFAFHL